MATELQLHNPQTPSLPSIFTARPEARTRLRDFFSSHIRNPNTRRAYLEAVRQFSAFCSEHGIMDLALVQPIHVAAFVEAQLLLHSKPTVKQRLAALTHAVRLDGGRPDLPHQPRPRGPRAEAHPAAG